MAHTSNDESAAKPDASTTITEPRAEDTRPGESSPATSAPDSSSKQALLPDSSSRPVLTPTSNKLQWEPALIQTLELVVFQHAWRAATDPSLRYLVSHKPFWHDYAVSLTDYHMDHWSDGDSFVVNDVGHPLNGAVYGRVFLQNYPRSFVQIGLHNGYWTTRLQSFVWMMLWSA